MKETNFKDTPRYEHFSALALTKYGKSGTHLMARTPL